MTLSRLISLPLHAALELAFAIVLMASPLTFEFGAAGSIVALGLGALLAGLALNAASTEGRSGMSVSSHALADWALAIATIGLAAVLGVAGDTTAFAFLALAGVAELALHATTRYSAVPA